MVDQNNINNNLMRNRTAGTLLSNATEEGQVVTGQDVFGKTVTKPAIWFAVQRQTSLDFPKMMDYPDV